jgi:hypothetical protein
LGISALAEITHASLSEDYKKVDLKLSFLHPFRKKKLLSIHAQVKHGASYVEERCLLGHYRFVVDKDTLQALSGSGENGIIAWVPPPPGSEVYWHAPNPRKIQSTLANDQKSFSVSLSPLNIARPTIRYDLTRLCEYSGWNRGHSRLTVSDPQESTLRDAKLAYKELKSYCGESVRAGKKGHIANPLAGDIRISRIAWRNVTRTSRTRESRQLSLRATPYLKTLLKEMPDRYACHAIDDNNLCGVTKERRLLIMWYREALQIDGLWHSLMLRVLEEVAYPSNWQTRAFGVNDIKQEAVLVSWWCKVPK